jgi:hypothetical protein
METEIKNRKNGNSKSQKKTTKIQTESAEEINSLQDKSIEELTHLKSVNTRDEVQYSTLCMYTEYNIYDTIMGCIFNTLCVLCKYTV